MVRKNGSDKKSPFRQRLTNEEKINKITKEYGAHFSDMSTGTNLPPEIMSQFLDNIIAFEDAYKSTKRIQLYDFIGKPSYRKVEDLTDNEIPEELKKLKEILTNHQISLGTLCEVPERELYRFMTEELFFEEKDDMHIPGMFSNYTYEEFHPNHEYNIFEHSNNFIRTYLEKVDDFYTYSLSSEALNADWHLHFRQSFSSFHLNRFMITNINFDTEKATVDFEIDFDGTIEGSVESLHFMGPGELNLVFQWDYWCIDSVKFPKNQ